MISKSLHFYFIIFLFFFPQTQFNQQKPIEELINSFHNSKIILLLVTQKYENAENVNLSVLKHVKALLEFLNYEVTTDSTQTYDIKFIISIGGIAVSAKYNWGTYFSGAYIKFNIIIGNNVNYAKWIHNYDYKPPGSLLIGGSSRDYSKPNLAPFQEAFTNGFSELIVNIFSDFNNLKAIKKMTSYKIGILRKCAISHLSEKNNEDHFALFEKALRDNDPIVRAEAVKAISRSTSQKKINLILKSVIDNDEIVQREAIYALGNIKNEKSIRALMNLLNDKKPMMVNYAISSLSMHTTTEATDKIINLFFSKYDSQYFGMIEYYLKESNDSTIIQKLIKGLDHKDAGIRISVSSIFAHKKDSRTIEPLIVALEKENSGSLCASHISYSLRMITRKQFGEDAKLWRSWWEENKGQYNK